MDHAAVAHRATAEYIYPKSRNSLAVRLFTARGDVDEAALLWWERGETDPAERRETALRPVLRDLWRDCHEAEIVTEHISAYIRYCFRLRSGSLELWYGPNGFRDTEPGMDEDFFEFLWPNPEDGFKAPDWSSGQVYYQLFPERFKNGDPSLTPEGADAWGAAPTRENFMGGDLRGIREKLPYIASLGATCLYITPVFEAPSNHKYDTVDYYRIDPHFGTEEDLSALASDAHALGIRVMLDGVFNHCGYWWPPFQDVVKNGEASGYRDWFFINSYPVTHETRTYDCVGHYKWMPKLNLANPELRRYFIEVGKHWLRVSGADGWRLDVADELPDEALRLIRQAAKAEEPDAVVLGEVWEDAVIKFSYGARRKYALGESLDSVMNYPFRSALIDFLCFRSDARALASLLLSQRLNYPEPMYWSLMNLISSHDVERARTALATRLDARSLSREQQAGFIVGDAQDIRGASMQRLAAAVQFSVPGVPSVYYGDETGMGGMLDPFDRAPFTMGARPLTDWYTSLGQIRNEHDALSTGAAAFSAPDPDVLCILRCVSGEKDVFGLPAKDGAFLAVINRSNWSKELVADIWLDNAGLSSKELEGLRSLNLTRAKCLLTGQETTVADGLIKLSLPAESALIFELS